MQSKFDQIKTSLLATKNTFDNLVGEKSILNKKKYSEIPVEEKIDQNLAFSHKGINGYIHHISLEPFSFCLISEIQVKV